MEFKDSDEAWDDLDQAILTGLGSGLSPTLVEHALRPRNAGTLEDPDGEATLSGICEDTVRIQLRLNNERIEEVAFMTDGCGATVACGSMVTELARGKTLQEAMKIDGKKVIEAFGGLPIEHTHCADLAANTLRAAINDALQCRREPWKRLYRPTGDKR
jgi:nitrogen fixation NifU-like protein